MTRLEEIKARAESVRPAVWSDEWADYTTQLELDIDWLVKQVEQARTALEEICRCNMREGGEECLK